jgi:hypothetical protein
MEWIAAEKEGLSGGELELGGEERCGGSDVNALRRSCC